MKPLASRARWSFMALALLASSPAQGQDVRLETAQGTVVIALMREEAPHQVKAFLSRVRSGFYDGGRIDMALPGFGLHLAPNPKLAGTMPPPPPMKKQVTARRAGAVGWSGDLTGGAAGERLFIVLEKGAGAKALNGHFGTFGQVREGLDLLARMHVGDSIAKAVPPPPYTRESAFTRTPKNRR